MSNGPDSSRYPAHAQAVCHPSRRGIQSKSWWPWAKHAAKALFFILVAYLLFTQARGIEWKSVLSTVRQYPVKTLMLASGAAAASYALYSCFDLLGRRYTGHTLGTAKVMTVNFICYAFNLSLGSVIGGVAFRYRLYARLGLDVPVITKIVFMSMLTNWLGYVLLAGLAFWFCPFSLPPDWKLDDSGLHIVGAVLFAVAMLYVGLCTFSRRRHWTIRQHELDLPSLRFASLQLLMSSANWLLMGLIIYILLDQKIVFSTVLGVLLVAAIAGVITHVPAGLGVLEAVFVALLSHQMPKSELVAALLTYRAIYYLAPLIMATVAYLLIETRISAPVRKRTGKRSSKT